MFAPRKLTLVALSVLGLGLAACGTVTDSPSGETPETTTSPPTSSEVSSSTTAAENSETLTAATPEAPTSEDTSTSEAIDTTADAGLVQVDPTQFQVNGHYLFSYATQHNESGTCLVTPDGATCTGVAGAGVPDIATPPFEGQRPGAVSASMGGIHYTILEGVPSAPATLEPGQRLLVDAVSCEVSATRDVTCTSGDTSFTISGVDRSIIA